MKTLTIIKLSIFVVAVCQFGNGFAEDDSDDMPEVEIEQDDLEQDIGEAERLLESLDREERAAPFPTFDQCNSNCTQFNVNGTRSSLLMCCDAYRKCCDTPVNCPNDGQRFNAGGNYCNLIGPFCSNDNNCPYGTKCCRNTDPSSPIKKYSCCWTPNK